MDTIPQPYRKIDTWRFLIRRNFYRLKRRKNEYSLGIALKESDKVIGEIKLSLIDWKNKNTEIS